MANIETLTRNERAELIAEFQEIIGGDFHPHQSMGYGSTDSANKVFFGDIDDEPIAVKPFSELGTRERAFHEADMMRHVQGLGFVAMRPRKIFEGDHANYLVTDYMAGISTMNQVGWERSRNPAIYQREITPLLRYFGEFTGQLHTAGLAHGDWQLKNFGRHRNGAPILVDLEKMKLLNDLSNEQKLSAMTYDIGRLASSLVQKRLLPGSSWEHVEQELVINMVSSYIEATEADSNLGDLGIEAAVKAMDMVEITHAYRR